METVKTTHHRLVVRFETPQDRVPAFDGALSVHGAQREWALICNGDRAAVQ